jgi:hypothetical protein
MGIVCENIATLTILRLPTDPSMATAGFSGYAWRSTTGVYTYVENGSPPIPGNSALCNMTTVTTSGFSNTAALVLAPTAPVEPGHPVLLYRLVTYEFKASTAVPGHIGLWRTVTNQQPEEIVAPFDTTAKFRFFVNDAATAQTAVPGTVTDITGLELTLDGISERPESDGTFRRVPYRTSVFFRNRIN